MRLYNHCNREYYQYTYRVQLQLGKTAPPTHISRLLSIRYMTMVKKKLKILHKYIHLVTKEGGRLESKLFSKCLLLLTFNNQ